MIAKLYWFHSLELRALVFEVCHRSYLNITINVSLCWFHSLGHGIDNLSSSLGVNLSGIISICLNINVTKMIHDDGKLHYVTSHSCVSFFYRGFFTFLIVKKWFHGLVVRTLDSESNNPSSSLGGTFFSFSMLITLSWSINVVINGNLNPITFLCITRLGIQSPEWYKTLNPITRVHVLWWNLIDSFLEQSLYIWVSM